MEIGNLALLALCEKQDAASFYQTKLHEGLFVGEELALFQFVADHVANHHVLPKRQTVEESFPSLEAAQIVEPASYYLDKLDERYVYRTLNIGLSDCTELVGSYNLTQAVDRLEGVIADILMNRNRQQMVEFSRDAWDLVKAEYIKKYNEGSEYGILFGWPYLDNMVGGLLPGDVASYVGRPAVGKTWKILYTAHHAWWLQKKNVLVMSMEMNILPLVQRLASLHSHISISNLKLAELTTTQQKKLEKAMLTAKDHPAQMWVVDGNLTSTPSEIYAMAAQLQSDVVFIDGAYLLRSDNKKLDRWTRVAENIELIKKQTSRLQIPTVCSYQFNRETTKKKQEAVGLENIGYADAIGQISSIVLGLFQDESVETIQSRMVNVLKGRDGATGQFNVKWDFQAMDFSEIEDPDEDVSDLVFV